MASRKEVLSDSFLDELFLLCFRKKDILEAVLRHLKYNYIPVALAEYKKILKALETEYTVNNTIATMGIVSQRCHDEKVDEVLGRIKKIRQVPDKEQILLSFEEFIKRVRFQELYLRLADLYNSDRQEEAYQIQAKESKEIVNFSIFEKTSHFKDVFETFEERTNLRVIQRENRLLPVKIPFGIDKLDMVTGGGPETENGDTDLFIARSGSGKSQWLRWRALSAARRGYGVLYISAEGTEKENLEYFDSCWTGLLRKNLSDIDTALYEKFKKIVFQLKNKGGHIKIKCFEEFESADLNRVRDEIEVYIKLFGRPPALLCLDYLGIIGPGDGKRYSASIEGEKLRRESTARRFRNLCNEYKMVGATADQVSDIPPSDYNKPEYVMTRHQLVMAKGLLDSFSYFFTWNVTKEEYKLNRGRIYADKCRGVKGNFSIRLCTNFEHSRFYDRNKTIEFFAEDYV